jgi:peptidoglycan/LPS O-acetylase OafA/YrhL
MLIQASWSLTVEETFYFLAPLFMLLARRSSFLMPLALGCCLLAAALFISTLGFRFLGTPMFVFSTTFFGHFLEFFAGFYLALRVMRIEARGGLRLDGWRYTASGLLATGVLIGAMMVIYRNPPLNHWAIIVINNFLIPLPIALLYLGLLRERTWLSRVLSLPAAGLLGRSSYSFYLIQGAVVSFLAGASLRPVTTLLLFALLWLASILLFALFEEPLNLRIRRNFRSQERSVGMPATLFRP